MNSLLNVILTTDFAFSVLRVTTPILFAALGALISNRAGIINIGMEGIMLVSALAGLLSAHTRLMPGSDCLVQYYRVRRLRGCLLFHIKIQNPYYSRWCGDQYVRIRRNGISAVPAEW